MFKVFVDTAAWVALLNTRDELHQTAQRQMQELQRQSTSLITTDFVLLELANMFSALPWRQQVIRFLDGLRRMPNLHIVSADSVLLSQGWNLFRNRADKEWSLTDCTSIFVMQIEQSNRPLLQIIISNKRDLLSCFNALVVAPEKETPSIQSLSKS